MPSALIFYHYFHPDEVVSSVHLTDLAEGLIRRGWNVTAMPCSRGTGEGQTFAKESVHAGIRIKRIWRPAFPQAKNWGRLLNSLWMLSAWSMQALFAPADLLIVGSDPPLSIAVAIPWKILRPSCRIAHWCFDLYPEAAVAAGLLKPGLLLQLLKSLMAAAYRRVDLLADIGEDMYQCLSEYPATSYRALVRPWAMVEPPIPPEIDPDQRRAVFGNSKLAIMYSGSLGRAHTFAELLLIARHMREVDAHFAFSIRGNRVAEVRNAVKPDERNISFPPLVPANLLAARLSCADIQVVSLNPKWTGTVVPSKFFGALAAGRPVLFIGSEGCSVAQLIRSLRVGWVCVPGKEAEIAQELTRLVSNLTSLHDLREHCHRTYRAHFAREAVMDVFEKDLRRLLQEYQVEKTRAAKPVETQQS